MKIIDNSYLFRVCVHKNKFDVCYSKVLQSNLVKMMYGHALTEAYDNVFMSTISNGKILKNKEI